MSRTRLHPEARKAELVHVAAGLFARNGVAGTTVSDIVSEAGVSQGTFYWYFESKSDVVSAVVDAMGEEAIAGALGVAGRDDLGAVEKLLAMRDALMSSASADAALLAFLHEPQNAEFHERLSRDAVRRTMPALDAVVAQGVAEGVFSLRHPDDASHFLAALLDVTDPFDFFAAPKRLPHHVEALTEFALRGLGCDEATIDAALAPQRERPREAGDPR